jgi:cytochrome c peroxidase
MNATFKPLMIRLATVGAVAGLLILAGVNAPAEEPAGLGPLPALKAQDQKRVELGKLLFFDKRLSGDAAISCADCHEPTKGYGDGMSLSKGYPGTLHYRNAPTLLNSVHQNYLFWNGSQGDLSTLARTHMTSSLFMNSDGMYIEERMGQVPEYHKRFREAFPVKNMIIYGQVTDALAAFASTLVSDPKEVPFDRYATGDKNALTAEQVQGLELFKGKAQCVQNGPLLSDQKYHNLGVPNHPELRSHPTRQVGQRFDNLQMGVPNYDKIIKDVGRYQVTKVREDIGKFRTQTLRELKYTGPYMHNGIFASLAEVVEFYNAGGGNEPSKSPILKPLGLTDAEKKALVAFLESLSSASAPHANTQPEKYGEEGYPYVANPPFKPYSITGDPRHKDGHH